ncbi:type VII secretion protein EccB [Amycolatopsis sp. cg5]|uniref:type VII secretion protein EccB n=1 Tax=Amycolatopsis sp. cg5 TaxID=3238802 RepID=UPI003523348E
MQSRKDQVQAYFFVVGRLAAAVTHGRPDVLQAPNRRLNTGTALGILVAGILVAIFGIYGLFVPGGDNSWRHAGAIVMDKTVGARYVYLDGQLRPVLNYSSARLATGKAGNGEVISVSQKSLAGTPVGQPIGILGAPDSLPTSARLATGPWTVCAEPAGTGPGAPGPGVTLLLTQHPGPALSAKQALLVSTPDNAKYLIWQGKRQLLPERAVLETLGYSDQVAVPVTLAWLNTIPRGTDIAVPRTTGVGDAGPLVDGRPSIVGQVLQVRNPALASDQLYLVRKDGVTPLTRTSAALVLAAPSTRDAYPNATVAPIQVGPAGITGAPVSTGPDLVAGLPPEPPEVVDPGAEALPCMKFGPSATGEPAVSAQLLPRVLVNAESVPVAEHAPGTMADRVAIPMGGGVLARDLPAPGAAPGTSFLITEVGRKYPLAGPDVLSTLGYAESSVVKVPAELLALLPSGPLLSVEGALRSQPARP